MIRMLAALVLIAITGASVTAQADRPLVDAMRAIYGLRTYTAFDWISGQYRKGTLTLQRFVRTPQLKAQAEQAARKIREITESATAIHPLNQSPNSAVTAQTSSAA